MPGKGEAIDPRRVILIPGPGVQSEDVPQRLPPVRGQTLQKVRRDLHRQGGPGRLTGEAAGGVRVAVPVGEVGLDVQDGRPVHQVRAPDAEHRTEPVRVLDGLQLHRGQPDGIRPEGRTAGEHPHPLIAAQPGRPDGGGPLRPLGLMEYPDQPDVGEPLQPPEGVRVPVGLLKDHGGGEGVHQPALAGHAEFGAEIAADMGDGLHGIGARHGGTPSFQMFSP